MYEKLREARIAEIKEQQTLSDDRIKEAVEKKNTWWLAEWTTDLRAQQILDGVITVEKFIELAHKKAEKVIAKRIASLDEKLERIASAPDVESITIAVDWVRSRTWGANPHAKVTIYTCNGYYNNTYYGTASGYGYDKESASVASALNQSDAVLKLLYDCKERILEKDNTPYNREYNIELNHELIGYGSGYSVLPYFEGGVGINCFARIFEGLSYDKESSVAYKWEHTAWGKKYDVYSVRKA